MTGATGVHLPLWNEERQDWLLRVPDSTVAIVPVSGGRHESLIPLSVLRYVERTREPLVVNDAAHDDRFARDPYFADIDCCSLLAFPVLSRGALRAVLVLDNRLIRGAFTSARLDAVKLIAGQLAISLDNAQLYAEVRRIADEHRRIADQQAALRRVATLVAQGESPGAVFNAVTAEMERLLDADGVALIRYEPGEEATILAHRGANAALLPPGSRLAHRGQNVTTVVPRDGIEDARGTQDDTARIARALGVRAGVAAPIVVDGRPWGVASAYWTGEESPPGDSEERIAQFAQLVESAIANADSRDQLIASRARLLTEADAARRRVVRDLHDGAQQRLVHTVITLGLAQRAMRQRDPEAESLVAEAVEYAQQANEELRELAHGILPADLTSAGLRGAIDSIVERLDLPVTVDVAPERLPAEIEANAYFIVAEAHHEHRQARTRRIGRGDRGDHRWHAALGGARRRGRRCRSGQPRTRRDRRPRDRPRRPVHPPEPTRRGDGPDRRAPDPRQCRPRTRSPGLRKPAGSRVRSHDAIGVTTVLGFWIVSTTSTSEPSGARSTMTVAPGTSSDRSTKSASGSSM